MVSAPKNGGKVPKSPIFAISPVKIGRGRKSSRALSKTFENKHKLNAFLWFIFEENDSNTKK